MRTTLVRRRRSHRSGPSSTAAVHSRVRRPDRAADLRGHRSSPASTAPTLTSADLFLSLQTTTLWGRARPVHDVPRHADDGVPMKIRVERDVARRGRCLGRPDPAAAGRQLPVLAGLRLDAGTDGALRLSGFDYEVSAEAELEVDRRRAGRGAGARPAAGRHHPQPARPAGRPRRPTAPGSADLRQLAVHPADPAGRRVPGPAVDARGRRHLGSDASPPRSPRSRSPPAATTRCPCSPASGSRSRATSHPGRDRPLPAGGARRCAWKPADPSLQATALVPARPSPTRPSR